MKNYLKQNREENWRISEHDTKWFRFFAFVSCLRNKRAAHTRTHAQFSVFRVCFFVFSSPSSSSSSSSSLQFNSTHNWIDGTAEEWSKLDTWMADANFPVRPLPLNCSRRFRFHFAQFVVSVRCTCKWFVCTRCARRKVRCRKHIGWRNTTMSMATIRREKFNFYLHICSSSSGGRKSWKLRAKRTKMLSFFPETFLRLLLWWLIAIIYYFEIQLSVRRPAISQSEQNCQQIRSMPTTNYYRPARVDTRNHVNRSFQWKSWNSCLLFPL